MKFIADVNLKPLAKRLRMLGFDCFYNGGWSFPDLVNLAIREDRVLLTMRNVPETKNLNILVLSEGNTSGQLRQVTGKYNLTGEIQIFSRCLVCNIPIVEYQPAPDLSDDRLPPSVRERRLPVFQCPHCDRLYWRGSHVERMLSSLQDDGSPHTSVNP